MNLSGILKNADVERDRSRLSGLPVVAKTLHAHAYGLVAKVGEQLGGEEA